MGSIIFRGRQFVSAVSEIVGYKSGIALSRDQMRSMVAEHEYLAAELLAGDDEQVVIRSEEFHELILHLLYRLGNIPSPHIGFPPTDLLNKHSRTRAARMITEDVLELAKDHLLEASDASGRGRAVG